MTRVLVLRALGIGDMLTAIPSLRAIRRAWPLATVTLGAPAALAPIVAASGAVDTLVDVPDLRPLPAALHHADVAVNLHGRGPQSTAIVAGTSPAALVAFGVTADWRSAERETHRWCRLLSAAGVAAAPDDLDLVPPTAGPETSDTPSDVVLHPGSRAPARRWPWQRWAVVAAALRELGCSVTITGTPDEREVALDIAEAAGLAGECVAAGRTSLPDLMGLVSRARLVVACDSGVAHLATAYRRPSVVLFGPVSPAEWGPPKDRWWHRALWPGPTSDPTSDRPAPALLGIQASEVAVAAEDLLRDTAARCVDRGTAA